MDLLIVAKEPVAGDVKTRLCPPCTPEQAALVAESALRVTLASATSSRADRVVLALDGRPGPWCPHGVVVVPQGDGELDQRLWRAWSQVGTGPVVQIGMDTPQVGSIELDRAMARLLEPGVDAVFGPAQDGGWWAVGLRRPDPTVFLGVRTSCSDTGAVQRQRLRDRGLRVEDLWVERDLDTWDDVVVTGFDARIGIAA